LPVKPTAPGIGPMEKFVSADFFLILIKQKKREIIFTEHAIQRAVRRDIICEGKSQIRQFSKDIQRRPDMVVEQDSEISGQRKFKAYYRSSGKGFMTYVLTINSAIRLITIYRTSRNLQKKLYKSRKRG
jgi:hypothetical protein